MVLPWVLLGLTSILLSNTSTLLITIKLYRDWDFRVSSVWWLFLTFFVYLWLYTVTCSSYYLWVILLPILELEDGLQQPVPASTSTQLDQLGIYAMTVPPRNEVTFNYIGLSQVLYNATGLALAVSTDCSLPCTLRFCGCCFPDEMLVQLVVEANRPQVEGAYKRSKFVAPPVANPVFVVTDIESSSALWASGDSKVMQRAIQVHDDTP